jgi:Aspartyl/Asparaginyl beta-hydroxylase
MTNSMISLCESLGDISFLLDELRANDDCWLLDTSRQDKIACQRHTQSILLRVAAAGQAPGIPNASVHASRESKVSSKFPRTMAWLAGFSARSEGELGRSMLVRLKPHAQIYRHVDEGDYYRVRHRFHVILSSPAGCWLECGGQRVETGAGQVVWFDNKSPYEEGNPSGEWSVRMIVDILPPVQAPIPSPFKNFALMKAGVDVAPLLAEIDGQPEIWDADTRRQTNIHVQRETSNIPLRGASKPVPAEVNQINWHPSRRTPYADDCPRIYSWVEQFAGELGGGLSRVSVVRLNPHGRVYPHIDEGDYYKVRDRYHLVLRSPGGSAMNSGGEDVVFRDGELWWFNNKAIHDAFNPSDVGRIHVIFDVLPARPAAEFWPNLRASQNDHETPIPSTQSDPPPPDTRSGLAAVIRAVLAGGPTALAPGSPFGPGTGVVQVELRRSGRLVASGWSNGSDYWDGLCQVIRPLRQQRDAAAANELMLSLGSRSRELPLADEATWQRLEANHRRGLFGYEIRLASDPARFVLISPFDFVATNRSFNRILENSIAPWGLTQGDARAGGVTINEFETRRFRIDLRRDEAPVVPLARGTRLVPLAEITLASVTALRQLLADYLVRSVRGNGRMVYLYHPSRGSEDPTRTNAIRQWMATRALIRIGNGRRSSELLQTIRTNIDFNLKTMYAEEGDLGLIFEGEKVKLGALALAALALTESPFAAEFESVRDRLARTIDLLWGKDGAFRTFYRPSERNDCQNFYPGEALLFWANRIVAASDSALLARFHQSFRYYRTWHLANQNPAFIPWHTQAYCIVWEFTREPELVDAILAMNDWLLGVQQWETAPHPDCQGRFYDPSRPFGPPHASSTAVYLEGLADAFAVARRIGDHDRAGHYRSAILRGLRSLFQLTFKDDVDMFFISKRNAVRGGVQTSEYDNSIRVDNVQHALTAIDKILNVFNGDDYAS